MKFAVITNKERDSDLSVTKEIVSCLSAHGAESNVVSSPADLSAIIGECQAAVTVGGDGTILAIADIAAKEGCPVIGVNKGNLGYLAGLEPDGISALSRLVTGDYSVENRMMLKATVSFPDKKCDFYALNDIVITHDSVLKLIDFSLSCDGFDIAHYRADGIIFATPTGSTAYSLSAGGPVTDPALNAIIVTPICAHTLNARPVIFNDGAMLSVLGSPRDNDRVRIYSDGGEGVSIPSKTPVTISKSPFSLKLIRFDPNSFYNILSKKIH